MPRRRFFRIVDSVQAEHPSLREPARGMPANVKSVEICLASGELPNQWCPEKGKAWFIPGKSPIRVSDVHRPVMIDDATGRAACPPYAGKRVHREIYEFWPSDLQQVFIDAGIPRRKPPQNAGCTDAGAPDGAAPRIVSPRRGSAYVMRLGESDRGGVALTAAADGAARSVYWFVDGAYVGRSAPGEALYWRPAAAGRFRVRAVDDRGRSDERPLTVDLTQ